jgi:hypothetical protein
MDTWINTGIGLKWGVGLSAAEAKANAIGGLKDKIRLYGNEGSIEEESTRKRVYITGGMAPRESTATLGTPDHYWGAAYIGSEVVSSVMVDDLYDSNSTSDARWKVNIESFSEKYNTFFDKM